MGIGECFLKLRQNRVIGAHSKTVESVIEGEILDGSVRKLYSECVFFYFLKSSVDIFFYTVFVVCLTHGAFGDRVCKHTDLRQHIDDGTLGASRCKVFNNVKSYGTAADYNDFLALTGFFRIFSGVYIVDHTKDGIYVSGIDVLFQAFDRWNKRNGTGGVYNDVRFELFDLIHRSFGVEENIQVFQSGGSCLKVFREIFHTGLAWKIGDESGKTADVIVFLKYENVASDFCCGAGCFHTGSTGADNNNVAVFIYFQCFVNIAFRNSRVYGTTDRAVDADTVSGTSNVTGDTFPKKIFLTVLNFFHPVRLSDQAASHSDDIYIAALENFFNDLRVTVVTSIDNRFFEFIFYGSCHVGTPSIRQEVGVDLILQGWVEAAGYVIHIYELIQVLEVLEGIFQSISSRNTLLSRDTDDDREPRSDVFTYFFENHTREAQAVFYRTTEFIGSFIVIRGDKLAHQVGVAAVDFNGIKADGLHTFCSLAVFFHGCHDFFFCHRARGFSAGFCRDVGRRNGFHTGSCGRCGSSGVVDLNCYGSTVFMKIFD